MSKPNLIDVIQSVIAAAIGIQSEANRKRDFENGSLTSYVIVGIVFTMLFIGLLIFVVSLVL